MKLIIFIMLLLPLVATTQSAKESAPFGGNLINNNQVTIYERADGSEITQINNYKSFLTKEGVTENKLAIPSYVTDKPMQPIVYTKENGNEYITYDGLNWTKYESNSLATSKVEERNDEYRNLHLVYHPENPIDNSFLVKFNLNEGATIKFTLINIQGVVLEDFEQTLPAGLNSINLNFNHISTGTYIYRIQSDNEEISKKVIKL
jgi:hypothetical protein